MGRSLRTLAFMLAGLGATVGLPKAGFGQVPTAPLACVGDCGNDGEITIDDLIRGVNITLGSQPLAMCPSFDRDGDGDVKVNEVILGVNGLLAGCLPDREICELTAAAELGTCLETANAAQRACFDSSGRACAPDDGPTADALASLSEHVATACRDDATVREAGYGTAATLEGLVGRLQAACRADAASLAARSYGGPQGAALAAGTTAAECLNAAHQAATDFMRGEAATYDDCIRDARENDADCGLAAGSTAAQLEAELASDITAACGAGNLEKLVAIDEAVYAARAAAQVRCQIATTHPDAGPFDLDCGPRDGLVDTPRGEYVQVVLDEATYGTRCGDGSPYAFWVRLAPEGKPVDNVVVGMQGGGVCIFADDCATRPADLFEAMNDQPETGGTMSNDPELSPFADWTKVYLPYCTQDVFIGGGAVSNFPEVTVNRFGSVDVRAALRYVRDVIWRDLDATSADGYRADHMRVLFGGFSAGGFGTIYNYHYVLDDLQWAHTIAYPDAGLALDNGQPLGVRTLGVLLISGAPPLGWGSRDYLPPYCFATDCGVGPVLLHATAPRLRAVPDQQMLILSNQVDGVQVNTTFFDTIPDWVNEMRRSYCDTRDLNGVQYFLPAISEDIHVISPRPELYASTPVDGVIMRDWLQRGFTDPESVTDQVDEGTLVDDYPGVQPFPCELDRP